MKDIEGRSAATASAIGREAVDAFSRLLRDRTSSVPLGDEYFSRDRGPLWSELAAAGWTCVADGPRPGADGDFGLLELASLAEQWGRTLVPLPLVETIAVRRWMASRPPPDRRLSYALVSAEDEHLVPFADRIDAVGAVRDGEIRCVQPPVPAGWDLFAPSMPIGLARGPGGLSVPARIDVAILTTATAVGAAASALEAAVGYAKLRRQFGRPIGSFQAVKHRLADMHARVEMSRSALAWACADRMSSGRATRAALALSLRTAEDAVQVHGGIAYSWEGPAHWPLRHVMAVRRIVLAAIASAL